MGLFDRFKKKEKETINTDGIMITSKYRFNQHEYIRLTIKDMGASGIEGLDKDQLTEKLLYFYDNMLPVEERIKILMNTFDIDRETAKQVEYVSFAKTSLIADYLYHKEKGATKFSIINGNRKLKSNLSIKDYVKNVGFMITNDGVPEFNIKVDGFKRWTPNETVPKREYKSTTVVKKPTNTNQPIIDGKKLEIIVHNNLRAESLMYAGKVDEAKKLLEDNLKMKTDTPATYRNLSMIYRREKDQDNEIRVLKAGLNNVSPNNEKHYKSLKYRLDEINKQKNPKKSLTDLDRLKQKEKEHQANLWDKDYYYSEESKRIVQEIKTERDEYLKNNPKDFRTRAVYFYGLNWNYLDERPNKERDKILELFGEGLYYEDVGEYEKAIEFYKLSDELNEKVYEDEINNFDNEQQDRGYLFSGKALDRIRICENKIQRRKIKKLEAEAKKLEKINPTEAIKKYKELNKVNPGLKKYDKRIYRMMELEAKELEETDPTEAIKKYEELNRINPGLKKYNKRIEIVKKKL